jgi:hypothetical protein
MEINARAVVDWWLALNAGQVKICTGCVRWGCTHVLYLRLCTLPFTQLVEDPDSPTIFLGTAAPKATAASRASMATRAIMLAN